VVCASQRFSEMFAAIADVESDWQMTVSGFIDESGKFKDHKVIAIGCVAAFNQHVDDFAYNWGRLLALNGLKNFHATKALKHHVPFSEKYPALGLENRIDAILPFIACIRKYLEVVMGCAVDVRAFKKLPPHIFKVYGANPSYMAFVRTFLQVVDFTPKNDRIVLVCDEDEETALPFYRLYKRIKRVLPQVKRKLNAISFCDDAAVFGIQAADLIASLARLDVTERLIRQQHDYKRLVDAISAPIEKHERLWFGGMAIADKKTLLKIAQDTERDLRKRKLIP